MLEWYVEVNVLLRAIRHKVMDARACLVQDNQGGAGLIQGYLKTDHQLLNKLWARAELSGLDIRNLGQHIEALVKRRTTPTSLHAIYRR